MAKKRKQSQHHKIPFMVVIIGIVLLAVASFGFVVVNSYNRHTVAQRQERILNIYSSIPLGDSYVLQSSNVFGDKRVYDWDKSRTYASEETFVHGDTVSNTIADLKKKIGNAGYILFDEPYNGGQQHFKSSNNEYVRLSVTSKLRDDAFRNALLMNQSTDAALAIDQNAGPSNVTIKVNLDDNNE
ncbi:MAG: hypothetical protein ABIP50_00195 [Candidatus Saccharimonadales bacterium]